ncbi:MAG: hypothetical protein NTY19_41575 [Planctomycetota bacterium]|nr:hypothetical protein [Planctomycetota bacterium]
MLQFGQPTPEPRSGKWRPLRNYPTRRIESRLLFLIGMFVLVLMLMHEAGKPQRWKWIWAFQPNESAGSREPDTGSLDTRIRSPRTPTQPAEPVAICGPDVTTAERPVQKLSPNADRSQQVTLTEVWSRLLEPLSTDDRACFFTLLKAARDEQPPPAADRQRWVPVLAQIEQGWQAHQSQSLLPASRGPVAPRPGFASRSDATTWARRESIEQLQSQWTERLQPALVALGGEAALTSQQRQTLAELQTILDTVFLSAIRDNTVFTSSEQDAWFRLLETLQRTAVEQLERDSCGQVGFAQLYREPHAYRGRLVTVSGTVRLGYYRPAPKNIYGITGYTMLWLRPVGSTNPIVIYSLAVPAGFPDVKAIEAAGRKPELHEDVEFTGYFFKRWAYRAEDGTRLAPLILAKMPRWQPSELASSSPPEERPSLSVLALCVMGAAVLAAMFVLLATRLTQRRGTLRTSLPAADGEVKRQLAELNKQE